MGSFHSGLKGLWIPYSCGYIPSDGDEKTEAQKRIGLGNAKQPARSKAGSEAQVLSQVALTLLTSKEFCWRVEGLKCVCSLCERTNHASSAGTVIYEIFRIGRLESSHAVLVSGMPTLAGTVAAHLWESSFVFCFSSPRPQVSVAQGDVSIGLPRRICALAPILLKSV